MNIVILSGSPRKGGNTEILAESFAQGASSKHNVDFISVRDYHINPCIGCNSCFKRDDQSCIQKATARIIQAETLLTKINGDIILQIG